MSLSQPLDEESIEVLVTQATDEFMDAVHRGERPKIDDTIRRYPQIAGILRQLLPAMQLMQQAGSHVLPRNRFASSSTGFRQANPEHAPPPLAQSGVEQLGTLGDFRLIRQVGRGGMGVVYEAEQISLRRRVALKVLPLAAALDPRQLQRFRLEAQAAAQLHHSHIVPLYSVGCEQGVYHYAMQYIEGRSLAEMIAQLHAESCLEGNPNGLLPWPESREVSTTIDPPSEAGIVAAPATEPQARASTVNSIQTSHYFKTVATLGIQAADALEYAHVMGVVHRDVKPANLMLDAQGSLYVTDFGLAQLRGSPGLTMTGDMLGTLRYMSPEQILAQRGVVDHRTDIYSLGATLYELLTLAPAFDAPQRHTLLWKIAQDEPVPPRQRNKTVPVDLETIVLKAMTKDPARRYATAKALADDLRGFLEHRPIQARRPGFLERATRWSRRHRSVVATAVGLLLISAVGFAVSTALIAREQWKTKAAHQRLALEQIKTKAAYEAEAGQRARAEKSFQQARQVVDFFTEVSEAELADEPELRDLRRKLLEAALTYYQDFIQQSRDAPSLQDQLEEHLANSYLKMAMILDEVGSKADALTAIERALQLQEKLVRNRPATPEFQEGLVRMYRRLHRMRGRLELGILVQPSVREHLRLSDEQLQQAEVLLELQNQRAPRIFSNRSDEGQRSKFAELSHLSPQERYAKLDEERRAKFDELIKNRRPEDWRAKFEELKAHEKALANILRPEQLQRLRQIVFQRHAGMALCDTAVDEALRLTDSQREQIHDERHHHMRPSSSIDHSKRDTQKTSDKPWRTRSDEALRVLTPEQMEKWKQLTGEPFDGEIRMLHRSGSGPRSVP